MQTKIYRKLHRDILLEYTYDDQLYSTEPYKILVDERNKSRSYVAIDSSPSNNYLSKQIFPIDLVKNTWGHASPQHFNFLKTYDYTGGSYLYDRIKIYFPINYNFGEYLGFHIRGYIYDYPQRKLVNLTNYHYHRDSNSTIKEKPALFYENRLWEQSLTIDIPAPRFISAMREGGLPESGSLNEILTDGPGLSLVAPLLFDFQFITNIKTIGKSTTLSLNDPFIIQIPQSPLLEELDLYIQDSPEGDFFEIFPRWNRSFSEFVNYINRSKYIGKVYQTEYVVTIFEQNIKGKTITFNQEENFEEKIEYRPILKYSTSLATIDVELRMIDIVTGELITRRAQYGLKPEQISKYSINIKKTKVRGAFKAKIYSKNSFESSQIDTGISKRSITPTDIKVATPSLVDTSDIQCYSKNALNINRPRKIDNYFNSGELKILLQPFDNIFKFILVRRNGDALKMLDLTGCAELKMVFKSETKNLDFPLYIDSTNDLSQGMCSFRIGQSKYVELKKLYQQDNSIFYITTTNEGIQTILYSGLFIPSDMVKTDPRQVETLNRIGVIDDGRIIDDPDTKQETAIVTRKKIKLSGGGSIKGATASGR
jgi:hypothetical protein